jgi:hypothetical protein
MWRVQGDFRMANLDFEDLLLRRVPSDSECPGRPPGILLGLGNRQTL